MTPCIVNDGAVAADDDGFCVGCGVKGVFIKEQEAEGPTPWQALADLTKAAQELYDMRGNGDVIAALSVRETLRDSLAAATAALKRWGPKT